MEIIIQKDENSSIKEEIPLDLAKYTIFAGENNCGKSNLIKAIYKNEKFNSYKKIFIPAESIQPQEEELKVTAKTAEFYKLIETIIKPMFNKDMLNKLIEEFKISPEKEEFINAINKELGRFGLCKHKFDVKIEKEKIEEDIIIKKTTGIVRDLYETDIDEVDIGKVGMGTQRLIVAALIIYYERKKIRNEKEVIIFFEEPELYLHPRLKNGLYESLLKLSEREDTMVLLTTHDPYFIELGRSQSIYKVFRDSNKKDATAVSLMEKNGLLGYKSYSEINYLIFGIPSRTYFLELHETLMYEVYNFVKDGGSIEDNIEKDDNGCKKPTEYNILNEWIIKQESKGKVKIEFEDEKKTNPKVSKLRHQIGHPKEETVDIDDELDNGIKDLEKLLQVIRKEKNGV
ncbi:MAG: AAA family ATPase [Actinomycetota bacterium]